MRFWNRRPSRRKRMNEYFLCVDDQGREFCKARRGGANVVLQ